MKWRDAMVNSVWIYGLVAFAIIAVGYVEGLPV